MNDVVLGDIEDRHDENGQFAFSVIKAAMALPGARVSRTSFLRDQLRPHCTEEQVTRAIDSNPAAADIPKGKIGKIADSVIKSHIIKAAGGSFATGIPGGLAMALTIPADTLQFVWHSIVIAQKLAYLYGWPDLMQDGEPDEETQFRMLVLMGSMLGIGEASHLLAEIAKKFADTVGHELPKKALTKIAGYPLLKRILKWFGIKLTKGTFARGVSKLIPIVSGVIGAGATVLALRPMAKNLKNHLCTLDFAKPPTDVPRVDDKA